MEGDCFSSNLNFTNQVPYNSVVSTWLASTLFLSPGSKFEMICAKIKRLARGKFFLPLTFLSCHFYKVGKKIILRIDCFLSNHDLKNEVPTTQWGFFYFLEVEAVALHSTPGVNSEIVITEIKWSLKYIPKKRMKICAKVKKLRLCVSYFSTTLYSLRSICYSTQVLTVNCCCSCWAKVTKSCYDCL